MPALAEFFLDDRPTAATHLAGILGIHEQHLPASFFRFVGTELLEQCPTSISNTFVYPAFGSCPIGQIRPVLILLRLGALAHVDGLQLFQDDHAISIDQLSAVLVEKIAA